MIFWVTARASEGREIAPGWFRAALGLPSKFEWKRPLLLRGGYVRELAVASYPHIHGGGGDFLSIAGGACGERRLA